MSHAFVKTPGSGLPKSVEDMALSSMSVVKPQLRLVKETFFGPQGRYPEDRFTAVLHLPFVSGYILGIVGAFFDYRGVHLSDLDTLQCVISLSDHFMVNGCDVQISLHHNMQQDIYRFGVEVGQAEFRSTKRERSLGLPIKFSMLSEILSAFLRSHDDRALTQALKSIGDGLQIDPQDYDDHVRRWNVTKEFGLEKKVARGM